MISATPNREKSIRAVPTARCKNSTICQPRYLANIDVADPPFDRKLGDTPAMTEQDQADIIAFINALVDGYRDK